MKTIALALLAIAAIAPSAAAEDMFVPVCLPRWLADALRDYSIAVSCPMDDEGGVEDSIQPLPRTEPMELPSVPARVRRSGQAEDGHDGEAFRAHSTDRPGTDRDE